MLIFDLETDGLLDELTRVHTMHVIDTESGQALRFNGGEFADGSPATRHGDIIDGLRLLEEADGLIGHNIIGFDIPALKKVYGFEPKGVIHDTLIYTRLIYPHIKDIDTAAIRRRKRPEGFAKFIGAHSLKAWGLRLGVMKDDYSGGWTEFNQSMETYAAQDVVVTKALWELVAAKEFCEESIRLEHRIAQIIFWQERHGFLFDKVAAEKLQIELVGRRAELEDVLRDTFKPWIEPVRKGGKPVVFIPKRDNKKLGYTAGVPVSKFKTVSFNPASRDHIANRLTKLFGWTPVEFTETGKPKVDETTLDGLNYPEAKLLTEYLTIDKRLGALADGQNAWLKKVRADGRLHGRVNTLGAITRRMSHSDPNMAQVPTVKVDTDGAKLLGFAGGYGVECRGLFIVAPGKKLVGCDAEGLELRMLGHYMAKHDGGAYADAVVNGKSSDGTDVHTVNQRLIGFNSRYNAKTFIYAYLYGAGALKLGSIVVDDMDDERRSKFFAKHPAGRPREQGMARLGRRAKQRVEEGLPALGKVQKAVQRAAAKKVLKTIDGGLLRVRSAHSALNTLLQGGGAVLMKKALVMFVDSLFADGWTVDPLTGVFSKGDHTFGFVANVHDEFQKEVDEAIAEAMGQLAADAIREAGEAYNLRCPMAGAYQTGLTWADSH